MKNFKHWAIQKLLKLSKTLDIDKALRDAYHKGIEATEKKYEGKINVWWDPTVRSYPQPEVLHLPIGEWSKLWQEGHRQPPLPVIRTNTDPLDPKTDFPEWLNSVVEHMTPAEIEKVPTIRDLTKEWDKDKTEERTAIDKLLYQGRQERQARHAG